MNRIFFTILAIMFFSSPAFADGHGWGILDPILACLVVLVFILLLGFFGRLHESFTEKKKNKMHGQGTYTLPNGDKYVGELKDGKRHGQGTYTSLNGYKYVGEYKDDKMHGQGTYTLDNGAKYVGEYKDDKMHGQGTYTFGKTYLKKMEGDKYVGEWKNDKMHGQGTYTLANGDKYVGEWIDNRLGNFYVWER